MIRLHCVMCGNLFRPEKLMQGTLKGGPVEYANCPKCGGVVIAPTDADTPDPIVEVTDISKWTRYDYIPMMFAYVLADAGDLSEPFSEWEIRLHTRQMAWSPLRDKFLEWCDTDEKLYDAWIAYWREKGRLTERAF